MIPRIKSYAKWLRAWFNDLVTWDFLRAFGESRFFHSAYFTLFAVPAIAKLCAHIPEHVKLVAFIPEVTLHLRLPFTWQLLFVSSLLASGGNVLFAVFCPRLVRRYHSWADFNADGRGGRDLEWYLDEMKPLERVEYFGTDVEEVAYNRGEANDRLEVQLRSIGVTFPDETVAKGFCDNFLFGGFQPFHFNTVRDACLRMRRVWRHLCAMAYLFATAIILFIIAQNVAWTLGFIFGPLKH